MQSQVKLEEDIVRELRCPICKSNLEMEKSFNCLNPQCLTSFPIVDGIPILVNEASSLFRIQDFVDHRSTTWRLSSSKAKRIATKLLPSISQNIKARANYARFFQVVLKEHPQPLVLILGGSVIGQGIADALSLSAVRFVESDVSFGPRTALICDAHDIPFDDGTFDAVVAQAVLEHVVDPHRCVAEIHRVLKADGLVYAETPFMQQVHAGKYDFTRFTHLGHRRLFRSFEEIGSGPVCGPGMALAWSYWYFLRSFVKSGFARRAVYAFASFTSFWLKYFDYYLIDNPGTVDAASSFYFWGRRSTHTLSDQELIKSFKGCDPP